MLDPGFNINKIFREQVEINVALTFSCKIIMLIKNVLRKDNNRLLSVMMFYENRNNMIFNVLSSVVYFIINNYVCDDYLCCPQTKLHVANKIFENKTYNDIS